MKNTDGKIELKMMGEDGRFVDFHPVYPDPTRTLHFKGVPATRDEYQQLLFEALKRDQVEIDRITAEIAQPAPTPANWYSYFPPERWTRVRIARTVKASEYSWWMVKSIASILLSLGCIYLYAGVAPIQVMATVLIAVCCFAYTHAWRRMQLRSMMWSDEEWQHGDDPNEFEQYHLSE